MNEIVPKSSKKPQKPGILQRIKHGVENSLQNELLKQSNTGFLLHEYTWITDTEFCQQFDKDELTVTYRKAVTTEMMSKTPLSTFSDQLHTIIKDCSSAKDYLLMSRFLFRLQKHTSTSITNLLTYVRGPYTTRLTEHNLNIQEYLSTSLTKRLFQLHALDPSYEFGSDLVWPPWQVFGTIYLERILEHTTPLHHQLPAQLDKYSIFDNEEKKLKDVRLLRHKTWIKPSKDYLIYALKPRKGAWFDRDYFEAYTLQQATREKQHADHTGISQAWPLEIETHTLNLMEQFFDITLTKTTDQTRYQRKIRVISQLCIQKAPKTQSFLKKFGTYICAWRTTREQLYKEIQYCLQHTPEIHPIERFICEDPATHDINIYTTQKTFRIINVLHSQKVSLKTCTTPRDIEMTLQKKLDTETPPQPSEHSFKEKREYIQRKQALAATLKTEWTPEEYNELFGHMNFKKRYFTHAVPDHNKVKQWALPNCFFVTIICGMLPLNFAEELCMQMLGKDPENPQNYKVRLGSTSFIVTPQERAQRAWIQAPEFIKIIEIAFQKAHTKRFIRNHTIEGAWYLSLATFASFITSGSIVTTRYMHTADQNIDTLNMYMTDTILLLVNAIMWMLVYEKLIPGFKEHIAWRKKLKTWPTWDIMHHGWWHQRVAFRQLFPKKITQSYEIEFLSYERIIDICSQLLWLSKGTSIISSSTGRKRQDPRDIHKHHAYTVLKYNPKTYQVTLVNPHNNTELITMSIIDFLYVFWESDIMKFNISKMFT